VCPKGADYQWGKDPLEQLMVRFDSWRVVSAGNRADRNLATKSTHGGRAILQAVSMGSLSRTRRWETGRRDAPAPAPILDSTAVFFRGASAAPTKGRAAMTREGGGLRERPGPEGTPNRPQVGNRLATGADRARDCHSIPPIGRRSATCPTKNRLCTQAPERAQCATAAAQKKKCLVQSTIMCNSADETTLDDF
jgi:hypothetical protein